MESGAVSLPDRDVLGDTYADENVPLSPDLPVNQCQSGVGCERRSSRNKLTPNSKRLEQGHFVIPDAEGVKQPLNCGELNCLLYGIEWQNARRYKRFSLPERIAA